MEYRLKINPRGNVSKKMFVDKLKELVYAFPSWKMDLSNSDVISMLYKHLGYCHDKEFSEGVDEYIRHENYNPTIAGLLKYISSVDDRQPLSEEHRDMDNELDRTVHRFINGITLYEYPNKDITFSKNNGDYYSPELPLTEDVIQDMFVVSTGVAIVKDKVNFFGEKVNG